MEIKEIYDALYAYRKYPLEEKEYLYPIFLTTLSLLESRLNGVQKPLNKENNIYGLIEVHLYRPFSKDYLTKVLPSTVEYLLFNS